MNNAMRNGQHNQRKAVTTNLPPITGTNFGKVAEQAIMSLEKNRQGKLEVTTSQIRVLLSMTNNFYKELLEERDETLNSNLKSTISSTTRYWAKRQALIIRSKRMSSHAPMLLSRRYNVTIVSMVPVALRLLI